MRTEPLDHQLDVGHVRLGQPERLDRPAITGRALFQRIRARSYETHAVLPDARD